MKTSQTRSSTRRGKPLTTAYAVKLFIGYLEGSGKSKNTIDSYACDLRSFLDFVGDRSLAEVTRKDIDRYHETLRLEGQKTNTRRRKLMTVRKWLAHLEKRKKLGTDVAKKFPAPDKLERIPNVPDYEFLAKCINDLPRESLIQKRNRALLGLLSETACNVSEAAAMRVFAFDEKKRELRIFGKNDRTLKLSPGLTEILRELRDSRSESGIKDGPFFMGYNRFGSLGGAISPRGVELLVKSMQPLFGKERIIPRSFRHSAIIHWLQSGVTESEVRRRLGLKTNYSLRVYAPLLKPVASAESIKSTNSPTSSA